MKRISVLILGLLFTAQLAAQTPTIKEKTKGLNVTEGYFDYYYNADKAQLWLRVDELNKEFMYVNYLAAGVGSNDIGLDRSQQGGERIVYFEKRGDKLFLIQPNLSYKAVSDNALERKSVEEAFASSVLHAFKIEAASKEGSYLIDLTPYMIRDSHDVTETLRSRGEGSFSLDKNRSVMYEEGTFNFPKNTEFEVMLTFSGSSPGGQVRSVVPDPNSITVRTHHSFVELPDDNFEPRRYDPRAGYYATSYMDYASPIDEPMIQRFINKHRLQKKNPDSERSEAVEPIIYYLDNGTPEPVRSALLDGAKWWNQAFEAAGYINAFQVKILPDDAHPLDIRYNMINWVHRSTRGWSYGGSVVDPRTGEILKGNVLLGSLRVRQDYMIVQGLLSPFETANSEDPRMMETALARIRQLSAHEVGHTLGLYHNFASSVDGRESVMDYPHPQVDIVDGELSLENAYDTGIGEWDKISIRYGYTDVADSLNENEVLEGVLEEATERGLKYISDNDARPQSGSHPYAHLWDYGTDPASQLSHVLEVRKIALENFGESSITSGTAMTELEEVLVPIYFFHRYQLEGTVKLIGGMDYTYKIKGDDQSLPEIVDEETQRKALDEMIRAIQPEVLELPENLLGLIPPKPAGMSSTRESFRGTTGPALDAYGIAATAAGIPISLILNPARANRLVEYGSRTGNLSLEEVIDELIEATWEQDLKDDYHGSIQKIVNMLLVENLIGLHASRQANPLTKAVVFGKLTELMEDLEEREDVAAQQSFMRIDSYMDDPGEFDGIDTLPAPPGSPIGSSWMEYCSN